MKMIRILLFLSCIRFAAAGQSNCTLFTDPRCALACRLYNASDSFGQGGRKSQQYLDSAIHLCPGYADAWHEISVPYLKRGDFLTWRKYIDVAVSLKPEVYLLTRGWCRFKFLRDYEGALDDFRKNDTITHFNPGQTGDGSYNMYVVMAICERELGHYPEAFHYFSIGIDSIVRQKGSDWVGLYDYVHRAVARIRVGDYKGALSDLDSENRKYDNYAETWYYQGIVFRLTGQKPEAKASFEKARRLFNGEGYHFTDPYCEMTDAIYLSDIDKALLSVQ
jgi:tetratricopeptide (TPR) repeat protein